MKKQNPALLESVLDAGAEKLNGPFLSAIHDAIVDPRRTLARQFQAAQQSGSGSLSSSSSSVLPNLNFETLQADKLMEVASTMLARVSQAAGALDPSAALSNLLGNDLSALAGGKAAPAPEAAVQSSSSSSSDAPAKAAPATDAAGKQGVAPSEDADLVAPTPAAEPAAEAPAAAAAAVPVVAASPSVKVVLASRLLTTQLARFENRDALQILLSGLRALAKRALVKS